MFSFVFAIVVSLIFFVSSAIIIPPFFVLSLTGPPVMAVSQKAGPAAWINLV
jgi:hypothetical protein